MISVFLREIAPYMFWDRDFEERSSYFLPKLACFLLGAMRVQIRIREWLEERPVPRWFAASSEVAAMREKF